MTSHIASGIAHISALHASDPQLSAAERADYERIRTRLHRAEGDLRRATTRGDAKKIAAAERAISRTKEARAAFLEPRTGHLQAPARIIGAFEAHWSGPDTAGVHRLACEMVLEYKDLSGPHYRTIRVLRDEGGPPTNPRSAPDTMGVAWFALAEQITEGKITVLGDEEPS